MPRNQLPPADFTAGKWPDAELVPDAPPEAVIGRALVLKLQGRMKALKWSAREVARRAGVSHGTVNRVLAGEVLADTATIVRLELALQVDLYPAGLWAQIAERAAPVADGGAA
ncbi:helix-turn-helix domain-containing protein [Kitasatospora sp. NPDC015120]|uniref:helix-turn-helix domain-containing protein n=1 Tax=Kitasatospora sp. NPDC015120 TaxID=3364023 RepID=UPI0036F4A32F